MFRRIYEVPILRGRTPGASLNDVNVGKLRSAQVISVLSFIVLTINNWLSFILLQRASFFDAMVKYQKAIYLQNVYLSIRNLV